MTKSAIFFALITLLLGAAGGYWIANNKPLPWLKQVTGNEVAMDTKQPARKPLFYRNPMNPTVTSPVPAKDSMGMDYIPIYASDLAGGGSPGTVVIDPTVVQNIGVRTALATRETISRTIPASGRVDYDEALLARLHPKVSGWIKKLFVSDTGTAVKKDTMLLSIYSPQLVASEQEYLLALKHSESRAHSRPGPDDTGVQQLLRSSRERLQLFDVPAHQMRALEKNHKLIQALHIHSPATGTVLNIGAREGQYVTPKTELYKIADLSKVWVYADVYEYEIPWIKLNDTGEIRLDALPGRVFTGKITYIYPYLDAQTRTNKIRFEVDNPDRLLKPNMFADVTLHAEAHPDALVIPTEAIIRTGETPRVFVQTGKGTFEPRRVVLGLESDQGTEILKGLQTGERVVTSAQFLLDSESSLTEAAAKMVAPEKDTAPTPKQGDMKGMKMDKGQPQ